MGNAAILFRVYAEGGKEKSVMDEISKLKPRGQQLEDVAFGIKCIKVLFMYDDKEGSSKIEERLKSIPGVSEVEVLEESLL